MYAYVAIDVAVPLGGVKKDLDAAAWQLPLITNQRYHHVSLGLLVSGQYDRRAVLGLQAFARAIQKLLVSEQIPLRMLVLKFDLYERLARSKVKDGPPQSRLLEPFNGPGVPAKNHITARDPGSRFLDQFRDVLLSLVPVQAERRIDPVKLLSKAHLNRTKEKEKQQTHILLREIVCS